MTEQIVVNDKTGGMKGRKPEQYHQIPWSAMREIAKVFQFGSEKYEKFNYRKGYDWSDSWDALVRHAEAFWDGEDNDPESGLPHMAHAGFHVLTLLLFMQEHPELDNRPRTVQPEKSERDSCTECEDGPTSAWWNGKPVKIISTYDHLGGGGLWHEIETPRGYIHHVYHREVEYR